MGELDCCDGPSVGAGGGAAGRMQVCGLMKVSAADAGKGSISRCGRRLRDKETILELGVRTRLANSGVQDLDEDLSFYRDGNRIISVKDRVIALFQ
jgi:hypothetical protein